MCGESKELFFVSEGFLVNMVDELIGVRNINGRKNCIERDREEEWGREWERGGWRGWCGKEEGDEREEEGK